jgi:hypothetical protein
VPDKRADTLLQTIRFIEWYTLNRAWDNLSDDELFREPVAESWGIRRRAECQTATPFGDGDWVADFDDYLARAADRGEAVEPLTTIGWLMSRSLRSVQSEDSRRAVSQLEAIGLRCCHAG